MIRWCAAEADFAANGTRVGQWEDNGRGQQEDLIWQFGFFPIGRGLFFVVLVLFPACLNTFDGDSGLKSHSRVAPQLAPATVPPITSQRGETKQQKAIFFFFFTFLFFNGPFDRQLVGPFL